MSHSAIGYLGVFLADGIMGTIGYLLILREQKKNH